MAEEFEENRVENGSKKESSLDLKKKDSFKTPSKKYNSLTLVIDNKDDKDDKEDNKFIPSEFDETFFQEKWIDFQLQSGFLESKIEKLYHEHVHNLYLEHLLRVAALREEIEDDIELDLFINHSLELFDYYRLQLAENAQVEQTFATPTHTTVDEYSKLYRPPDDTLIEKGKTPKSRLSQLFTPRHHEKYTIAFDADDSSKTDDEILKLIEVKNLDTGQVTTLYDAHEKETSPVSPVTSPPDFSLKKQTSKHPLVENKENIKSILANGTTTLTTNARNVPWLADQETNQCMSCEAKFSFFKRRHHCRNCGRIFCNACSKYRATLAGFKLKQRVCKNCHLLFCEHLLGEDEEMPL